MHPRCLVGFPTLHGSALFKVVGPWGKVQPMRLSIFRRPTACCAQCCIRGTNRSRNPHLHWNGLKNHHWQSKPRDPWRPKDEGLWKDHSYLMLFNRLLAMLCSFVAPPNSIFVGTTWSCGCGSVVFPSHSIIYLGNNNSKMIVILNHSTKVVFTSMHILLNSYNITIDSVVFCSKSNGSKQRLNRCWKNSPHEVLSNPEKRSAYDASMGHRPGEGAAAQALRGTPPAVWIFGSA